MIHHTTGDPRTERRGRKAGRKKSGAVLPKAAHDACQLAASVRLRTAVTRCPLAPTCRADVARCTRVRRTPLALCTLTQALHAPSRLQHKTGPLRGRICGVKHVPLIGRNRCNTANTYYQGKGTTSVINILRASISQTWSIGVKPGAEARSPHERERDKQREGGNVNSQHATIH